MKASVKPCFRHRREHIAIVIANVCRRGQDSARDKGHGPIRIVQSGPAARSWNYEVDGEADTVSGGDVSEELVGGIKRESQISYGFKAEVTDQDEWKPRSAAILQGFTPTSGAATATDVVATYAFGWELANRRRLDSSMRYGTEHGVNDTFNQWAPSVVLRVPVNDRWNVHAEYFGIYSQGAAHDFSRAYFSPGTHYLLTPNLELGVWLGWGLTEDARRFFSNVGIGWRF
jgi:hypothetical protein